MQCRAAKWSRRIFFVDEQKSAWHARKVKWPTRRALVTLRLSQDWSCPFAAQLSCRQKSWAHYACGQLHCPPPSFQSLPSMCKSVGWACVVGCDSGQKKQMHWGGKAVNELCKCCSLQIPRQSCSSSAQYPRDRRDFVTNKRKKSKNRLNRCLVDTKCSLRTSEIHIFGKIFTLLHWEKDIALCFGSNLCLHLWYFGFNAQPRTTRPLPQPFDQIHKVWLRNRKLRRLSSAMSTCFILWSHTQIWRPRFPLICIRFLTSHVRVSKQIIDMFVSEQWNTGLIPRTWPTTVALYIPQRCGTVCSEQPITEFVSCETESKGGHTPPHYGRYDFTGIRVEYSFVQENGLINVTLQSCGINILNFVEVWDLSGHHTARQKAIYHTWKPPNLTTQMATDSSKQSESWR